MPAAPADSPRVLLNSLVVLLRTIETCHDRLVALAAMLPARQLAGTDGKEGHLSRVFSRRIGRLKLELRAAAKRFGAISATAKARAMADAMEGKKGGTTTRDDDPSTSSCSIRTSDALPTPTAIDLCRMIEARLEVSRRLLERLADGTSAPTPKPSIPKASPTSQVFSILLRLGDGELRNNNRRRQTPRQPHKQRSVAFTSTSTIGAQSRSVIVFSRAIRAMPHTDLAKPLVMMRGTR